MDVLLNIFTLLNVTALFVNVLYKFSYAKSPSYVSFGLAHLGSKNDDCCTIKMCVILRLSTVFCFVFLVENQQVSRANQHTLFS